MFRPILFAAGVALLAASPTIASAAPCHDAKGKFVKCGVSKSAPTASAMSTKK